MFEKEPSDEPHIQQRADREKPMSQTTGIEEDVRRLKRQVLFLTVLVVVLGASVFVLSVRFGKIIDHINFLYEHFSVLLDVIKGALNLG